MLFNFHHDKQISVAVESDTKTVYAYYISGEELKGDLWLLNLEPANNPHWNDPANLPFPNKDEYIETGLHHEISAGFDINNIVVKWEKQPDSTPPVALIFYLDFLVGKIGEGDQPGYSTLVVKDGPLAKRYPYYKA